MIVKINNTLIVNKLKPSDKTVGLGDYFLHIQFLRT